jgi:N-acetylglutamate synthase-like GNAT family acetyltransferase
VAPALRSHPRRGVYTLRPASAGDQAAIRRLVYQARINPRGLDWSRFVLAVDPGQRMVGCGQIKPHGDGSRELASIAVDPGWREGGVASAIIGDLMQAGPPLWLVCRSQLTHFYARFGFRPVLPEEPTPAHFRRMLRLGRWLTHWAPPGQGPCVMVWEGADLTSEAAARLEAE